jgi:predicted glutamine amidotransferase
MCRLFGMSAGSRRATATFWLLDAPDSLSAQSHREPDGTGLGWFDEHDVPHVCKQPLAAYEDRVFAERARAVRSRTFVAHIRFASTGALEERNTHPFEQNGRLFGHNGVLGGLEHLDTHLGADTSLVKGDTDSERLFALITREIAAVEGDVERGIETACAWVAENLPLFAINFILVTTDELWALRYPATHDLFVLERAAGAPLAHRSTLGTRVSCEHGVSDPLVVIASEPMDADTGWRPLASGELLHVSPGPRVNSRVILPDAPARPLTFADLGERERASQAHAPPRPARVRK